MTPSDAAVAICVILMVGLFLTVAVWQVLAVARERARSSSDAALRGVEERLTALEARVDEPRASRPSGAG